MAYKVRHSLPCNGCGEATNRRINRKRVPQCLACSIKAVEENAIDQHYRRGANYERWQAGMARAVARWGTATGGSATTLDIKSVD